MSNFPSRETVERLRKLYPVGCKVRLCKMDDAFAPPVGTIGEVVGVDDIGSLLVKWSNGSSLNVIFNEDIVVKI